MNKPIKVYTIRKDTTPGIKTTGLDLSTFDESEKLFQEKIENFHFTPYQVRGLSKEFSGELRERVLADFVFDLLAGFPPGDLTGEERSKIILFLKLCAGESDLLERLYWIALTEDRLVDERVEALNLGDREWGAIYAALRLLMFFEVAEEVISTLGIKDQDKKKFEEYVLNLVNRRTPSYGIKHNGQQWRTKHKFLGDKAIQAHLAGKYDVGVLGPWYPRFALLDIDSRDREEVKNIQAQLCLDDSNSMLLESESPNSYHLIFIPQYNNKPPTLRLLQDVLGPHCRSKGIEIYPQENRLIRLPFGKYSRCADFEYYNLKDWQDKLYWFLKVDEFDLMSVAYIRTDSGLWLPNKELPKHSYYEEGRELYEHGLQRTSSRHESEFKVIYYLWRKNVPPQEAFNTVWQWINRKHNGFSKDILKSPDMVFKEIQRQVSSWYREKEFSEVYPDSPHNIHGGYIAKPDIEEIVKICEGSIPRIKFLFNLVKYAYPRRYRSALRIHSDKLIEWASKKTYQKRIIELEEKGIVLRGSGYLVSALSKALKLNWKFKSSSDAVLFKGRAIDTFEGTVKLLFKPRDFRDMLMSSGTKPTTATEIIKRIYNSW
ncbi:MAG TPA: hypothetical protein VM123_00610 [archaeon]|nr:hypothetical protein [archaeon]